MAAAHRFARGLHRDGLLEKTASGRGGLAVNVVEC
jgi:hypothetical protein